MKILILSILFVLFTVHAAGAQTSKRIKFEPCHRIEALSGDLTKKKNGNFLYLIRLTKEQTLKLTLSARPNYKEVYVNVYYDFKSHDSKPAILQGETGHGYQVPIGETGEYSIMVFASRRTTRFTLLIDVEDTRWKC